MVSIKQGSSGADVKTWQKIIGVTADGQFGAGTKKATIAWQQAHGITGDGVVGPATWAAALTSNPTVAQTVSTVTNVASTATQPTIKQGSTGAAVKKWQQIIGVTADGQFGAGTKKATIAWQQARGITGDGVVGPATWAAAGSSTALVPTTSSTVVSDDLKTTLTRMQGNAHYPTIKNGSKGTEVKTWQQIIGVTADGQFGPGTLKATKTWQSNHGITPDGVVGAQTWKAAFSELLTSASTSLPGIMAPATTTDYPTLSLGSVGNSVSDWQIILNMTPDGQFGPLTDSATKTWQQNHGITPDGVVGPVSWATARAEQAANAGVIETIPVPQPETTFYTPAPTYTPLTPSYSSTEQDWPTTTVSTPVENWTTSESAFVQPQSQQAQVSIPGLGSISVPSYSTTSSQPTTQIQVTQQTPTQIAQAKRRQYLMIGGVAGALVLTGVGVYFIAKPKKVK